MVADGRRAGRGARLLLQRREATHDNVLFLLRHLVGDDALEALQHPLVNQIGLELELPRASPGDLR